MTGAILPFSHTPAWCVKELLTAALRREYVTTSCCSLAFVWKGWTKRNYRLSSSDTHGFSNLHTKPSRPEEREGSRECSICW